MLSQLSYGTQNGRATQSQTVSCRFQSGNAIVTLWPVRDPDFVLADLGHGKPPLGNLPRQMV